MFLFLFWSINKCWSSVSLQYGRPGKPACYFVTRKLCNNNRACTHAHAGVRDFSQDCTHCTSWSCVHFEQFGSKQPIPKQPEGEVCLCRHNSLTTRLYMYIPYSLDQTPRLLLISSCDMCGYYLRAAFINFIIICKVRVLRQVQLTNYH